jgi:hypothetical protein
MAFIATAKSYAEEASEESTYWGRTLRLGSMSWSQTLD